MVTNLELQLQNIWKSIYDVVEDGTFYELKDKIDSAQTFTTEKLHESKTVFSDSLNKLITDTYSLAYKKSTNYLESLFQERDYDAAKEVVESVVVYAQRANTKLTADIEEIVKQIYLHVMEKKLCKANKSLKERKYNETRSALYEVKHYAAKAGEKMPPKAAEIAKSVAEVYLTQIVTQLVEESKFDLAEKKMDLLYATTNAFGAQLPDNYTKLRARINNANFDRSQLKAERIN